MTDINQDNVSEIVDEIFEEINKNDIYILTTTSKMSNMTKERFVVPQSSIEKILKIYVLPEELQKEAVNQLVDRRHDWLDLTEEEQLNQIKSILLLETVTFFLYDNDYIREGSDMYHNGFDKDGNVSLDVFYVEDAEISEKLEQAKTAKRKLQSESKILPFKKRGKTSNG